MGFSYGNFYGLTGILALYADPAQFGKMLQIANFSADARENLVSLYQELYAIKTVFDNSNMDPGIPHVSVTVDKNSMEAQKFLRGYNNYLNYREQQAAMFTSDTDTTATSGIDLAVDDLDFSFEAETNEDTDKTTLFVDNVENDNLSSDDLDFDSSSLEDLDLEDLNLDEIPCEDAESLQDSEISLFSTYNSVYNPETDDIDLIKWGEIYPEEYDTEEQRAKQLSWGAAIKQMKRDTEDVYTAKFIAQRKKLPTSIANCNISLELKSCIRNALGSDMTYQVSSFEEDFALRLLDSIHHKAIEPARVSLDGENSPKLELYLKMLESAINAPSNAYVKRFGVSMSELALWNTRTQYVINNMTIKFVDSLVDPVNLKKSKAADVITTLQHLLTDCDYLLGNDNSDIVTGPSEDDIQQLVSSCEDSPIMIDQFCEAFLKEKFSLANTDVAEITRMLACFIKLGIDRDIPSNQKLHAITSLLASQDNLVFSYYAYTTLESAVKQLGTELMRIYNTLTEDTDPLQIKDLSLESGDTFERLQAAMLSLFKGFVMRTGICGCTLCYFDKMYAMFSQMRPAIISTAPVKFTDSGYERARDAILLFRGYLNSMIKRINRMCKEV